MVVHRIANPAISKEVLRVRSSHLPPVIIFLAGLAQMVEHLICNQDVASSILATGTSFMEVWQSGLLHRS
jgi:hypothetical protein